VDNLISCVYISLCAYSLINNIQKIDQKIIIEAAL
jgi:hypothetical protein